MQKTMHAMVLTGFGGPENLRYAEIGIPALGPDDALVRVHASAANRVEIDIRAGVSNLGPSLPHIMGPDGAGEVVALGSETGPFQLGDRVLPHTMVNCGSCINCLAGRENVCTRIRILGSTVWGTHAQYVRAPVRRLVALPPDLPFEIVAAGNKFCTAWEALAVTAGLKSGETVLINSAGGGVGSCAVQVARHLGAYVIAGVGADSKSAQARANGADEVVNYESQSLVEQVRGLTAGQGVDVALDIAGGSLFGQSLACVADGGRLALVGAHGGKNVGVNLTDLFRRHVAVLGCGRWTKAISDHVMALLASGALKPTIFKVMPLASLNEAHALMTARSVNGRIVLVP